MFIFRAGGGRGLVGSSAEGRKGRLEEVMGPVTLSKIQVFKCRLEQRVKVGARVVAQSGVCVCVCG